MNYDELDDVASRYALCFGQEKVSVAQAGFREGAIWHESDMIKQGLLIRLVGGPADGKVMPRPVIGYEITFRQTFDDGTVKDNTYSAEAGGVWRHKQ